MILRKGKNYFLIKELLLKYSGQTLDTVQAPSPYTCSPPAEDRMPYSGNLLCLNIVMET